MSISAVCSDTFLSSYRQALKDYIFTDAGEEALMQAYELGRQAAAEQRNILDLVTMHQDTMMDDAFVNADPEQRKGYLTRSEEFLAEVMAPFEMMHRGFVDTINQLQEMNTTLEQRVKNRTRDLQESQKRSDDLARLYQILSNINSAIVRIRTKEELFKEACRIAVNQGGYTAAGIVLQAKNGQGLANNWYRLTQKTSSATTISIERASPKVRAALARVIREGKPVVSCRVEGEQLNLNSASLAYSAYALLPLLLEQKIVGVLALFSGEECAFNGDEMRLLQEMAGDLSYSLDHIDKAAQLKYLAYYDSLTGQANQSLLLERIPVQLEAARRSGTMVALVLLDLVQFSDVNDTYGRHIGDNLLKQVAARLCRSAGSCESTAKLGVDRFALSFTHIMEAGQVAHKLEQEVLHVFATPFRIDHISIHLSVQVGISLFPADARDGDTLYKNAEIALKRAQSEAKTYLLYDPAMNEQIIHSVTMEAKLRKAIEQDQLVVHYQPKVSTADKSIVGMEALLRFADPEEGIVPPENFIHLLETTGMIVEVGFWMMEQAASALKLWRSMDIDTPRVAVNVSPLQLERPDFLDRLKKILQPTDGRSDGLDIEITEGAVMKEIRNNIPKLEALRELGFHIAIDDFGTGYSSLSYLSRLPVHSLKIDRSFIVDMTEHPNSLAIVSSIISLAHSLKLEVVAEGVEREEQAKLLALLRCDLIQGFVYSPPLPAEAVVTLLQQGSSW